MIDRQNLKGRGLGALDWIDNHWGPGRFVLSCLAIAPIALILVGALLGAQQAYTVDSASAVVPAGIWMDIVNPDYEFANPLEGAVLIGIGVAILGCVDFFGRITFAYLLWVPEPVWGAASHLIPVLSFAVGGFNLVWAAQKVYRVRDPSLQAPEGGIDG